MKWAALTKAITRLGLFMVYLAIPVNFLEIGYMGLSYGMSPMNIAEKPIAAISDA